MEGEAGGDLQLHRARPRPGFGATRTGGCIREGARCCALVEMDRMRHSAGARPGPLYSPTPNATVACRKPSLIPRGKARSPRKFTYGRSTVLWKRPAIPCGCGTVDLPYGLGSSTELPNPRRRPGETLSRMVPSPKGRKVPAGQVGGREFSEFSERIKKGVASGGAPSTDGSNGGRSEVGKSWYPAPLQSGLNGGTGRLRRSARRGERRYQTGVTVDRPGREKGCILA